MSVPPDYLPCLYDNSRTYCFHSPSVLLYLLSFLLAGDLQRSSRPDAILVLSADLPADFANLPPVHCYPRPLVIETSTFLKISIVVAHVRTHKCATAQHQHTETSRMQEISAIISFLWAWWAPVSNNTC